MLDRSSNLEVPAERVLHPHLLRRSALRLEKLGTAHQDAHAARPRRRHVQPVPAEEELHAVRGVLGGRGCHGVDDDGRLLALELVDGSDPRPVDALGDLQHLGVVWRDDEDFVERHGFGPAVAIRPVNTPRDETLHDLCDAFGLFPRRVLVSLVHDGNVEESRPREGGGTGYHLRGEAGV